MFAASTVLQYILKPMYTSVDLEIILNTDNKLHVVMYVKLPCTGVAQDNVDYPQL